MKTLQETFPETYEAFGILLEVSIFCGFAICILLVIVAGCYSVYECFANKTPEDLKITGENAYNIPVGRTIIIIQKNGDEHP